MAHHYSTTLTFQVQAATGDDVDLPIDVTVRFSVGSDDEVSDITLLKVGDRFRPWRLNDWSDGHFEQLVRERLEDEPHVLAMIEAASEDEAGIEEVIAERRWEVTREFAA